MPNLPSSAWANMPDETRERLTDNITMLTYTVLYYGSEGQAESFFGETGEDAWVERTNDGANYFYTELRETPNKVVLFDQTRDRTVTIDLPNYDLTILDDGVVTQYTVVDFADRLTPFVIPDIWI